MALTECLVKQRTDPQVRCPFTQIGQIKPLRLDGNNAEYIIPLLFGGLASEGVPVQLTEDNVLRGGDTEFDLMISEDRSLSEPPSRELGLLEPVRAEREDVELIRRGVVDDVKRPPMAER